MEKLCPSVVFIATGSGVTVNSTLISSFRCFFPKLTQMKFQYNRKRER